MRLGQTSYTHLFFVYNVIFQPWIAKKSCRRRIILAYKTVDFFSFLYYNDKKAFRRKQMAFIKIKDKYSYDSVINTDQICYITQWGENNSSFYRLHFTNGETVEISANRKEDLEKLFQSIQLSFNK